MSEKGQYATSRLSFEMLTPGPVRELNLNKSEKLVQLSPKWEMSRTTSSTTPRKAPFPNLQRFKLFPRQRLLSIIGATQKRQRLILPDSCDSIGILRGLNPVSFTAISSISAYFDHSNPPMQD
jgi:hypothetical protein